MRVKRKSRFWDAKIFFRLLKISFFTAQTVHSLLSLHLVEGNNMGPVKSAVDTLEIGTLLASNP